jgi:uncharacterized protein (TIRG00374 family)
VFNQIVGFAKKYKSYIFIILLALLFLKTIIPQLDNLKESLLALKDANPYWIAIGIAVYFAAIPALALQIMVLALKPIGFFMTLKVQMAGQFVSKLLPSFVGVVTLNMYYLVKKKHTTNQAFTVMSTNAITSGIAYSFLVILAFTQSSVSIPKQNGGIEIPTNLILFLIVALLGGGYILMQSVGLRKKIKKQWTELKSNLHIYKNKRLGLLISVVCNALGSSANIFVLYVSARAISLDITFADALVAYTFSNIAITLIPTPGGIGAAEAGLYAGLVFAGVDGAGAITTTLIYRLITYWLPIIPGYYFFLGLRKNILSQFSLKKRYVS